MTAAALLGWLVAAVALTLVLRLRTADRRRAELVARACHEVRGPLTAARLAAHAAGRDGGRDRALHAVDHELARAGDLLADLTAAPRGGRAAEVLEPVDVALLLRRARDAWRPAARLRGRDVLIASPGAGLVVHGDPRRLQQALAGLVGNAVEHGAGLVALGARACAGVLRLEVADAGPGLPAPAGAVAGAAPRAGGPARGRGLAIVSDIAARHGGRVLSVRDETGHRVVLELPLAEARP